MWRPDNPVPASEKGGGEPNGTYNALRVFPVDPVAQDGDNLDYKCLRLGDPGRGSFLGRSGNAPPSDSSGKTGNFGTGARKPDESRRDSIKGCVGGCSRAYKLFSRAGVRD